MPTVYETLNLSLCLDPFPKASLYVHEKKKKISPVSENVSNLEPQASESLFLFPFNGYENQGQEGWATSLK